MPGERILLTGGAGFLGAVLTPALIAAGYRVTVIDNFRFGQNSLAMSCSNSGFQIVRGDARNAGLIKRHLQQADIIIPLAAIVGAPACDADPLAAMSTNRDAVQMICELASKDQRIIVPITNSGYGIGERGVECTEDSPLNPISLYGRSKVEAEQAVLSRGNAISLRLATVFGMSPRMRLDLLVNDFVYRAVNDRALVIFEGHFKRNYIHVRDVARAFLHAIQNFGVMKDKPYNVGLSDANLSKLELCARIKAHIPKFYFHEAPIGEDIDKRDYIVSNARIEATGYKPAFSLDDGILELIKGYQMIRNQAYGNA